MKDSSKNTKSYYKALQGTVLTHIKRRRFHQGNYQGEECIFMFSDGSTVTCRAFPLRANQAGLSTVLKKATL